MRIKYINGSYIEVEGLNSIDTEQVRDAIVVASNEGFPFRGKPRAMADDVLFHILNMSPSCMSYMPVIYESSGGIDKCGHYMTNVVFQTVSPFFF